MDSECAPEWIRPAHLLDFTQFRMDFGPTELRAALPSPVKPKSLAMPCHNGFGLHNHETRAPSGPQPGQNDPEPAMGQHQFGACRNLALQGHKLMPKGKELQMQPGTSSKSEGQRMEQGYDEFTHGY
jgi:hypothetical protein